MNAERIVSTLLETDEIDPKGFVDRMFTLDMEDLRQTVQREVPGIAVPVIHAMRPMQVGDNEHVEQQDVFVYFAKEPVSDDGFDHRNYPSSQDQTNVFEVIHYWFRDNGGFNVVMEHKVSNATYKKVSKVILLKVSFRTEKNVQIVGHDNETPSDTVHTKRTI